MANYATLKAAVQAVVKTNGNAEITGANMQSTLLSIINSVGAGYQFMGVATPSTSPGTPDYNVFYVGGAGTYANFGTSITVPVGSICVFKYNGSWTKEQIALFAGIDDVPTANSNNLVKSGGVASKILRIERGLETAINGGEYQSFNYSSFDAATLQLPNDIELSHLNDYLEFKVKIDDTNNILLRSAQYNNAYIKYSSSNKITIKLLNGGTPFIYQGSAASMGSIQTIRLTLSSIENNTYTYSLTIDGTAVSTTATMAVSSPAIYNIVGSLSTMDLYYIKTQINGVTTKYSLFSEIGTIEAGAITDNFLAVSLDGLAQVQNDLDTAESNIDEISDTLGNIIVQETGTSTTKAMSQKAVTDEINGVWNGKIVNIFSYSDFTATTSTVPCNISMSQAGDYVEAKVNVLTQGGKFLWNDTATYNNPCIGYGSRDSRIYIRLSVGTSSFVYDNAAVQRGTIQTIRVQLTSVSGGSYSYTAYLDGNSIGTITTSEAAIFDTIGHESLLNLYYIDNKSNGVLTRYTAFGEMQGAIGVTDVYDQVYQDGLNDIANMIGGSGKMFYTFTKASTAWDCVSEFIVYQKIKNNIYCGYWVSLYDGHSSPIDDCYLWRLTKALEYEFDGSSMSATGKQIITGGENEFVMHQKEPPKTDATGGYHGDEKINVTGGFIEFYIDGVKVEVPNSDVPLTPINSFMYRERAALYETENANEEDDATTVGTQFAWHVKETKFANNYFKSLNRVDFTRQIPFYTYSGLVCIARDISNYAYSELYPLTNMGTGSPTQVNQFNTLAAHQIVYRNSDYQINVKSRVDFGTEDENCSLFVYNSTQYNKYYRKTEDITGVDMYQCEVEMEFENIDN